jgi:hypothetical protein
MIKRIYDNTEKKIQLAESVVLNQNWIHKTVIRWHIFRPDLESSYRNCFKNFVFFSVIVILLTRVIVYILNYSQAISRVNIKNKYF